MYMSRSFVSAKYQGCYKDLAAQHKNTSSAQIYVPRVRQTLQEGLATSSVQALHVQSMYPIQSYCSTISALSSPLWQTIEADLADLAVDEDNQD